MSEFSTRSPETEVKVEGLPEQVQVSARGAHLYATVVDLVSLPVVRPAIDRTSLLRIYLPIVMLLVLTIVGSACNRSQLKGLGRKDFQETDILLRRTVEAAERGDLNDAEFQFMQGPHGLLHNLDLPLRNRNNEELGFQIFTTMNDIEVEFADERRVDVVLRLARELRAMLPRAADVLGQGYTPSS